MQTKEAIEGTVVRDGTVVREADAPADKPLVHVPEHFERKEMVAQPASFIEAIAAAASNPRIDMDRAERLWKMHQEMTAQQALVEFNAAMARAQAKLVPVIHNADNTQTHSRYAKLDAICKVVMPIVTAEGLSVSYDSADCPTPNWFRTVMDISKGGHVKRYHLDLPLDDAGAKGNTNKTALHASASTRTYSKRILLCGAFNVATQDTDPDTDGNNGGGPEVVPDAEGKKALEKCGSLSALQTAWKALTVEQRKTLNDVKESCKVAIKKADEEAGK